MATIKASELVELFEKALIENWGYIFGAAGKEWTAARQKQIENKMVTLYGGSWKTNSEAQGNDYYKSARYGSKWIGHMVADCSGMFVWAFSTKGIRISHSSHYQYTDYCVEKGTLKNGLRSNGNELQPGTAVFVYKDERKRYTHVGLYVGNGNVIEAAGTESGVITSKVTDKKWNRWGMMKNVDYTNAETVKPEDPEHQEPAETETPTQAMPTVRRGDRSGAVRTLQQGLLALGYELPKYGADGDFGAETEKAVKAFQKASGLSQDGVVGKKTWAALAKALEQPEEPEQPKTYTYTVSGLTGEQADALIGIYGGEKKED